jgi:hypothetical protein
MGIVQWPPPEMTQWYVGSGNPSDSVGDTGDLYLDNVGRVWVKEGSSWALTGVTLSGLNGGGTHIFVGASEPDGSNYGGVTPVNGDVWYAP